jgi:hypothetical protein
MSRRRLILHIGTQKTGTTSFQKSLYANRKRLLELGIRSLSEAVPGQLATGERRRNLVGLAHLMLRRSLLTGPRIRGVVPALDDHQRQERLARRADRLKTVLEETIILSAEAFCFFRTAQEKARLRDFIARTGRAVTVLLVLRDQASWRASWASQLNKPDGLRAIVDAQTDANRIDADWYFDRAAILDFWSEFDLQTLQYGDSDNIVDDLFRRAGVDPLGLKTGFHSNTRRLEKKADG